MNSGRNEYMFLSAVGDIILNTVATAIAYFVIFINQDREYIGKFGIILSGCVVILSAFVYAVFEVYSSTRFKKLSNLILRLVLAQSLMAFLGIILVTVFSKDRDIIIYIWLMVAILVSLAFLIVKKIFTIKLLHFMRTKNKNPKNIIIIGTSPSGIEYSKQVNDNLHFGYNVIGYVGEEVEKSSLRHIGEYNELDSILKEYEPHEVILALNLKEEIQMQDIISVCEQNGIRVSIIPEIYKYFKSVCQVDMVGNLPIINTRAIPLDNPINAAIKRIIDIVVSLILITLTLPIMIFAAIGVRLSSKGPIIFKQKRVGKNNKEFVMYKFRSMKVNDQESTGWTTNDDPRKTKFGTFMRKTGIDELPQLFNVLFGTMSMVGPRPELPVFVKEYSKTIPLYMVKHQVKPGITGLAQIYGYRGDTSIEKRIELDIKYIENWTVLNEIKILLATPFKMFNRNERYIR